MVTCSRSTSTSASKASRGPISSSKDSRAELGGERLLAEIEAGLQGATLGEKREVNLVFPEDYGHEPLRGKAALFQITHQGAAGEGRCPTVDDEFARDLEHESLAAMRDSIRKRLEDTAQRKADALVREAARRQARRRQSRCRCRRAWSSASSGR